MSSSRSRPEFFVDRSLGDILVPAALRAHGWTVHPMREVYGARAEMVADVEWLQRCAQEGWVALTKDKRIRSRPSEIDAVARHGVRQFTISSGQLTGADQAQRLVGNAARIERACANAGPFIYVVHDGRIERIYPRSPRP